MSEQRRNEYVRRLLWSARNHLEAALARADELDAADEPMTPLHTLDPPVRLDPFVLQEIAIHTGVATEHFLKVLILTDPKTGKVPDGDLRTLIMWAARVSPNVDQHKKAIKRLGQSRNDAVHRGKGPDRGTVINNVLATEEIAHHVIQQLRSAGNPVLAEFKEYDEFLGEEAFARALDRWQSDVHARIATASERFAGRTSGRDADEVAALLELDREGWRKAADPEARYENHECPACRSSGYMILEVDEVELPDGSVAEYARVARYFCPACGLDLDPSELEYAGVTDTYSDPHPELLYLALEG